jgi:hypothetical protein
VTTSFIELWVRDCGGGDAWFCYFDEVMGVRGWDGALPELGFAELRLSLVSIRSLTVAVRWQLLSSGEF